MKMSQKSIRRLADYLFQDWYDANECGDPESYLLDPKVGYYSENRQIERISYLCAPIESKYRYRIAKRFGRKVKEYYK